MNMLRNSHDFFDFMKSNQELIALEYERIQKRVKEDPGTAGDQGEENWAEFFENWLPPIFPIVTKGRIINSQGLTSNQIDLLILNPVYPRSLYKKKLYFAGGVIAAFECKITLRPAHLRKYFVNAAKIKQLYSNKVGSLYDELNKPIVYGLLCHSANGWKLNGNKLDNKIFSSIGKASLNSLPEIEKSIPLIMPSHLIDFICITDTALYSLVKFVLFGDEMKEQKEMLFGEGIEDCIASFYIKENAESKGTVLGSLLTELYTRIAYTNIQIQPFAEELKNITFRIGEGIRPIRWDMSILSQGVLEKLSKNGYDKSSFSKWDCMF